MTSIEKLIEELEGSFSIIARAVGLKKYNKIVRNAIKMHKQEIVNTYIVADSESTIEDSEHNAEKYYEREFKKN
jgi:hypothetical protein